MTPTWPRGEVLSVRHRSHTRAVDCYLIMRGFVRSRCAWTGTKRTPRRWPQCCRVTSGSSESGTPASRPTRSQDCVIRCVDSVDGERRGRGWCRARQSLRRKTGLQRWRITRWVESLIEIRPDDARVNEWFLLEIRITRATQRRHRRRRRSTRGLRQRCPRATSRTDVRGARSIRVERRGRTNLFD